MKKSSFSNICRFFLLLFLCISFEAFAQQEEKQSEIALLTFNQLDSLFKDSQNDDFKTLEIYAKRMLEISNEHHNLHQKNIAFYNLAKAYIRQGKKKKLQQSIDSLEYYATQANDIYMLSNCINFKGTIAYEDGNLATAFAHYKEIIALNASSEDQYMTLVALNNIALIKKELQAPQEALKDVHTVLLGFIEEKESYSEVSAIHLIGELYLDMYRLDGSLKYLDSTKLYFNVGFKKSEQYKDTYGHFLLLSTKAQWLQEKKQYEEALKIFQESLAYFEHTNNLKWSVFLYLYLGRLYDKLENHEATITILEKASAILANKDFRFNDTPEIYLLLAKNYFYVHNPVKADRYLESYKSLIRKIQQDNRKLYAKLHNTYDVATLEEKISQIETKASHKQKIILFVTITSILGIGFIAFFYYRKNRNNSKKLAVILEKLEQPTLQKEAIATPIHSTKIEDTEVQRILASLAVLEDEEYYLATSCTLNSVAKEIGTNTSYLSKIVNAHKGKSFANYLNEYRIHKVLVKLKNEKQYQQYTLKYIAEQFGFTRHETFSRVFKKQTGISPSYYLKKLKNDNL